MRVACAWHFLVSHHTALVRIFYPLSELVPILNLPKGPRHLSWGDGVPEHDAPVHPDLTVNQVKTTSNRCHHPCALVETPKTETEKQQQSWFSTNWWMDIGGCGGNTVPFLLSLSFSPLSVQISCCSFCISFATVCIMMFPPPPTPPPVGVGRSRGCTCVC